MMSGQLITPTPLHNFRPVGGLPTADGGVVRADLVWRSAAPLSQRQPASEAVVGLGVATILDLRDARERASTPGAWQHPSLSARAMPVFEDRLHEIRFADLAELYAVMIDDSGAALARAFSAIAAGAERGVLIHCTAGKDRTGVLSALVLDVLGVARTLVLDDFAQSQQRLGAEYLADLFADVDAENLPGMAAHRATASPPELLQGAFDRIERTWGGSAEYLGAHGVDDDALTHLRKAMLVPASR